MIQQVKNMKRKRFDFERAKQLATSSDREVRKDFFLEYFEDFSEYPSYFFDNERIIDPILAETMRDILKDPRATKEMRAGVEQLLDRLPS